MRKVFLLLAMVVLLATPAFATVGINNAGTPAGEATTILYNCPSTTQILNGSVAYANCGNLLQAGTANGGATSMTTTQLAVPVTYDYVRKAIAALAAGSFTAGTLANGSYGQILSILITNVGASGTFTLTPATATGWASIQFNLAKQTAVLLYVNDTVGWVVLSVGSSASSALPTITLP